MQNILGSSNKEGLFWDAIFLTDDQPLEDSTHTTRGQQSKALLLAVIKTKETAANNNLTFGLLAFKG